MITETSDRQLSIPMVHATMDGFASIVGAKFQGQKNIPLNIYKISMESKTFARTSARRYRIVDAEER
jgi:hypothetical protein